MRVDLFGAGMFIAAVVLTDALFEQFRTPTPVRLVLFLVLCLRWPDDWIWPEQGGENA